MLKFTRKMQEKIQAAMPEKEVKINIVTKNNGIKMTALQILSKENTASCSVSPNIYMEPYYAQYDGHNMDELVSTVMGTIAESESEVNILESMKYSDLKKDRIFFTVINASKNEELLKDVPHVKWHDLAIVFRCMVSEPNEDEGLRSFLIKNPLAQYWKISTSELMAISRENTPKLFPWTITSLENMLFGMSGTAEPHNLDGIDVENNNLPLYVATTGKGINGAHVFLYSDALAAFGAKLGKNFYIFPSSIHELILVPEEANEDVEQYKRMVCEVNANEVLPDEILSDNVYYYDRASCEVKVA